MAIYSIDHSEVHTWVMGEMLGPYGRDHGRVLDWAWQTWPWEKRSDHMAGSTSHVVALIRRRVQCEIDLHRSSCVLLSASGILPPLVFRPWCEVSMRPWVVALRVGRESRFNLLIERSEIAPRVFEPVVSWNHFEQIHV